MYKKKKKTLQTCSQTLVCRVRHQFNSLCKYPGGRRLVQSGTQTLSLCPWTVFLNLLRFRIVTDFFPTTFSSTVFLPVFISVFIRDDVSLVDVYISDCLRRQQTVKRLGSSGTANGSRSRLYPWKLPGWPECVRVCVVPCIVFASDGRMWRNKYLPVPFRVRLGVK